MVAAEPVTLANKRDPRISKILPNETEVGNWLARIKVNKVDVNRVIPHIIIDRNTVDWQHFLNKYRNLTSKFTYSYVNSPEELRKELEVCKRNRNGEPIWIMAKDGQGVVESAMEADKLKDQSVFYIIHGNYTQEDADLIGKRPVIFANENRQEVEAFILNAYRRDQQVIFPSAVKNKKVVLAVMPGKDGKTLPIRKNELNNWRDILKAKLVEVSTLAKLDEVIRDHPEHMIVVVAPTQQDRALSSPAYNKPNLKRVIIDPFYDTTARGSTIADSNKLYIATCGYDASEYLRYLRYNIRTPEHRIRKSYQS